MKYRELSHEELSAFLKTFDFEYETVHRRLCFAIIKRIHRRTLMGYDFREIVICPIKEIVIEGNHRYIAYQLAEKKIKFRIGTSSFCDSGIDFNRVDLDVLDDWDTHQEHTRIYLNDDFLKDML